MNIRKQRAWRMLTRQPLYPWLLGIYPILHLYAANLSLVIDTEVIPSIALMMVGTSIAFYVFNRLMRDIHLAGFIVGLCSLAFSLCGHIYVLVFMPRSLGIWTILVLLALVLLILALFRLRSHKFFGQATLSLNIIALVLLILKCIELAAGIVELSKFAHIFAENRPDNSALTAVPKVNDSATRPDIYYIIPDAYPSNAWSTSEMNYDNSEFSTALEDRGFVVVDHAKSNYGQTHLSLPSILNMRYYEANPSPYTDLDYLRLETANSEVARYLAQLGYTYVQFLSGFLVPSSIADIVRDFTIQGPIDIEVDVSALSGALSNGVRPGIKAGQLVKSSYKRSFFNLYIDTSLLRLARSQFAKLRQIAFSAATYQMEAPERFLATTDEIQKISAMPEATFTIVHLLKPHSPVVFNENGQATAWNFRASPEEYFAELRFVNARLLKTIDSILETSENPPIIILQADHGSTFGSVGILSPQGSTNGQEDATRLRYIDFDIYSALLIPPSYTVEIPQIFTSVNTFPLILNAVFGGEFEFNDNRLFELVKSYKDVFDQKDVTAEFADW